MVNSYDYFAFKYNSGDVILSPYYTNLRGIHFNLGYDATKHGFRKKPYSWRQVLKGYYSFSNKSFGGDYEAIFKEVIGKWDILLNGAYDQRLQYYFFGLGNNSLFTEENLYYQQFSKELQTSAGIGRIFSKHHMISLVAQYQQVEVENEEDTYVTHYFTNGTFDKKTFAGGQLNYRYHNYNDEIVPTKGFEFSGEAQYLKNLKESNRSINRYQAMVGFYIPLSKVISISSRTGGGTVTGDPEFYQMSSIGGGRTLRGYIRQRFIGKTSFYNGNDLRFIETKLDRSSCGPNQTVSCYCPPTREMDMSPLKLLAGNYNFVIP